MNNGRRVELDVTYNNAPFAGQVGAEIESLTYVDNAADDSDSIDITLDAQDSKWLHGWLPEEGATLRPRIIGRDWNGPGDTHVMECGLFILDDVAYQDAPTTLQVGGVSKPSDTDFSELERETIWKNTSIKRIGESIAGRYGLGFTYDADDYDIECDEQDGTDSSYYNTLCKNYGLILKVYAKRLWVYDRERYKGKRAVQDFDRTNIIPGSLSYNTTLSGTYTGGYFTYTDADKDLDIVCSVGGGNHTKNVNRRIYREQTGKELVLGEADAKTLLLKAFALIEYQTMQYADIKGQAELLKTSTGEALDALVALLGLTRQESKKATAKERFLLAEARADTVAVPAGTRVKTQGGRYFNTLDYAEIPPGATYVDTIVQAEEAGAESSGILAGEINILVDPIPYIASVSNVDESTGGLDVEDDDSLTERAYLAPSRFSCAGPREAYEYHVREWRSDVTDVQITSPEPCVIAIYFVMEGGRLPNATEREELTEYISGENLRPLCDKVVCVEPEEVPYNIAFTYWIGDGDQRSAGTIQEKVTAAVQSYQSWQRHLGRDINPTELIAKIREAGAKRVKLTAPADIVIGKTQLPKCTGQTVTYGGLEDD